MLPQKTQKTLDTFFSGKKEEKEEKPIKRIKVSSDTANNVGTTGDGSHSSPLGDGIFPAESIKISLWNVNGIRASQKENYFLKYVINKSPDILCLNETKIDADNFKKEKVTDIIPKEYSQYWNFCKPPQKGYAGTAIFSKVQPISVVYDIGKKEHDQEGRTITLEFDKFYLVTSYVPNAGQGLKRLDYRVKQWDIDFQKYLNDLRDKKPTILCGDLNVAHENIDLKNPQSNQQTPGFTPQERQGFTNFLQQGWIDSFRNLYPKQQTFSFWSYRTGGRAKNVGWRLDYFVINEKSFKAVKDQKIRGDIMGSDHCPLELDLDLTKL